MWELERYLMKIRLVILAFCFIASPIFSADSTNAKVEYGTYINARYDFELKYPKNILIPDLPPPDNNDAGGFISKDKQVDIAAQGKHLVINTWKEEYQGVLDYHKKGKITYKHFNKKFFVVSGYEGDQVFYSKVIWLGPDDLPIVLVFDATYPKKDKKFWDPIITVCANSLKPSKIKIPTKCNSLSGIGPNTDQYK
jgi:hypothetical protein